MGKIHVEAGGGPKNVSETPQKKVSKRKSVVLRDPCSGTEGGGRFVNRGSQKPGFPGKAIREKRKS